MYFLNRIMTVSIENQQKVKLFVTSVGIDSVFSPVRTDPVWGRAQYGPVEPEGQTGPDHKQAVLDWTGLVWTSPFLLMVVIQIWYGSYQVTAKTAILPYF